MKERPFERPWMADYVDRKMTIDSSRSRRTPGLGTPRAPARPAPPAVPAGEPPRRPHRVDPAQPRRHEAVRGAPLPGHLLRAAAPQGRDRRRLHPGADAQVPQLRRLQRQGARLEPPPVPAHPLQRGAHPRAGRLHGLLPRAGRCAAWTRASTRSEVVGALETFDDDLRRRGARPTPRAQALLPHVHHYLSHDRRLRHRPGARGLRGVARVAPGTARAPIPAARKSEGSAIRPAGRRAGPSGPGRPCPPASGRRTPPRRGSTRPSARD